MKLFFLSLFFLSTLYIKALPKDTVYHVRFVSSEDTLPLCFATVKAINSGIVVASWETDLDGYIRIKRKEIRQYPKAFITLNDPGFEKIAFKADTLFKKDAMTIIVKPQPVMFDEIQIISYKVPMIDEEPKSGHRRHKKRKHGPEKIVPEKFPVYSPGQCIAYEALQKGVWLNKDTLMRKHILAYDTVNKHRKPENNTYSAYRLFQQYLMYHIRYPSQAIDFLMEEKVYLSFEFDEKGAIQYIKVLRGNSVDLVLAVANAMARMPRLNLRNGFSNDYNSYPPKKPKPVRIILPVKFILK